MDIEIDPRRVRRRYLKVRLVGVVAVATLPLLYVAVDAAGRPASGVERSAVVIDTVRRGSLDMAIRGAGALVPKNVEWITTQEAGRVGAIGAEPGDSVRAGMEIVKIMNPELEQSAIEARRDIRIAISEYNELKATLDVEELALDLRVKEREAQISAARRRQPHLVADLEEMLKIEQERAARRRDASRWRLDVATARIVRLREKSAEISRRLGDLRVRASNDGVVQELKALVGQNVTPGMILGKMVKAGELEGELYVAEGSASEIPVGASVLLEVGADELSGRVAAIDSAVSNGTVRVRVEIEGPVAESLRTNQHVEGRIHLQRREDVLVLGRPWSTGVRGWVSLFVIEADGRHAARRRVQIGLVSIDQVEILQGAREGERIVLSDMSEWDTVERVSLN